MRTCLMGLVGTALLATACGESKEHADGAAGFGDSSSEMAGHSGGDAEQAGGAGLGGAGSGGAGHAHSGAGSGGAGSGGADGAGHAGSDAEQPGGAGLGGAGHSGAAGADSSSDCQCTAFEQRADWTDRACVCATATCPDVEEVLEPLDSCSGTPRIDDYGPVLRRGCGRIEYYRWAHGVSRFQFDALDGTSLAVQLGTDTASRTCDGQQVAVYAWGDMMDLSTCADYSECTNCRTLTSESPSIPACEN